MRKEQRPPNSSSPSPKISRDFTCLPTSVWLCVRIWPAELRGAVGAWNWTTLNIILPREMVQTVKWYILGNASVPRNVLEINVCGQVWSFESKPRSDHPLLLTNSLLSGPGRALPPSFTSCIMVNQVRERVLANQGLMNMNKMRLLSNVDHLNGSERMLLSPCPSNHAKHNKRFWWIDSDGGS